MASNPYSGTDFEASWRQGFAAGFLAPEDEHPAPSPLEEDQQTVYSEGVLAGSELSLQGIPLPDVEPAENVFAEVASEAGHGLLLGHDVMEIGKDALKGTFRLSRVGVGIVFAFAWEAVFGPDRSAPYFDEAAEQAFLRVRNAIEQGELTSENVEFYMAACDQTDHGTSDDDAMTRQGWWHGKLFLNFDRAVADARNHDHSDNVRVLRFQTASPDTIDFIDVSGQ